MKIKEIPTIDLIDLGKGEEIMQRDVCREYAWQNRCNYDENVYWKYVDFVDELMP